MRREDHRTPDNGTCVDRRRNRRLTVRLDIVVRLTDGASAPKAVEHTCTRDISPGDMRFETTMGDLMGIGDEVDVDIELPAASSTILSDRRLAARGHVVRIQRNDGSATDHREVAIIFDKPPAFRTALA